MSFLFHNFLELTVTGLVVGSIYALVALGYTLVYGVLQLINFAHSEVFMYGTFAVGWVFVLFKGVGVGSSASLGSVIGILLVCLVAAMAVSGAVALLVERVAYRPVLKSGAPRFVALISAIGASFALSEIMGLRDKLAGWVGLDGTLADYVGNARQNYSLPVVLNPSQVFKLGDASVTNVDLLVFFVAILMMVALDQFIRRTRLGRGIRAVAQDPESAALMGVDETRVIRLTFLIGGIMAGVAATLYMLHIGVTSYSAGFILGVKAFTAAVMGGIGNLRGALLGGLILGVAENWGAAVAGAQWKDVVSFVLLIGVLLVRPHGLLGEALGRSRA